MANSVFETDADSTLEPIPFNRNVPSILSKCEQDEGGLSILSKYDYLLMEEEESAGGAVSCADPTPIGSSIQVVVGRSIPMTESTWHQDYSSILLDLLRPLSHQQQQQETFAETPGLASSCFKKSQQQQEEEQASIVSEDTVIDMPFSSPDRSSTSLTSRAGAAGLNSTRSDQCWNDHFQELADFRQIHGHSLVRHSHPGKRRLLLWVKRQRYQYKMHKKGKPCTMTEEREATLEQLGFIWDSHAATWDERFSELVAFQSECGHCKVPTPFPPSPQLAGWVRNQRRQSKLFLSGKRAYMNKERMIQLSSLGFDYNPRKLK
jgi:hypothetical protein